MKTLLVGTVEVSTRFTRSESVIVEVMAVRAQGKTFISRGLFRRMCKRHGASQSDTRQRMRDMGLIDPRASFSYGAVLTFDAPEWRTFEEWLEMGRPVRRGASSFSRDLFTGKALFNNFQVEAP